MEIDGTWKTYEKKFKKKWHFDPRKKNTKDLKFICNIKTNYDDIIKISYQNLGKKNKNFFLSQYASQDDIFQNRNKEIESVGYKKKTNEFYQLFHQNYPNVFEKFIKITKLKYAVSSLIIQPPGNVLGWHQDTHIKFRKSLKNTKNENKYIRYMLMIEDWKWGHFFSAGNDTITQWRQGDLFYWDSHIFHCGANAGLENKITMNITGLITKDCLHLKK